MAVWKCENCGVFFKRGKCGNRPIRFCSNGCYHSYRKDRGYNYAGVFKPGSKPWNKGKKGIHLSPQTEFKKGVMSNKIMPVGSVCIRKTKKGTLRSFIKISMPNKWVVLAKKVWEDVYGEIPKGLFIHHIDRNQLNDNISNLSLVDRVAHINIHRDDLLKSRERNIEKPGRGYVVSLKSESSRNVNNYDCRGADMPAGAVAGMLAGKGML